MGLKAIAPTPKSAHWLLASIDNLCECSALELLIHDFVPGFGGAPGGFSTHAVNLAPKQIDHFK